MNSSNGSGNEGFDVGDFQLLRLTPKRIPQQNQKKPPPVRIPTFGCVMWSPKFAKELKVHGEFQDTLHTTLQIGRILSEAVVDENPNMDWKKPFLLLDIAFEEGHKVKKVRDNSILIPVYEKLTATNSAVPAKKRLWQLVVGQSCLKLGIEMLRRVPTTIMLWGARQCPFECISEESKFQGQIIMDTFNDEPTNVLIFHLEEITRDQKRTMQGNFKASDLQMFSDDYRRRIINNMKVPYFAVHLSKLSAVPLSMEVQKKFAGLLVELLGDSDDSEGSNEPGCLPPNEISNNVGEPVQNGTNATQSQTGNPADAPSALSAPPIAVEAPTNTASLGQDQVISNSQKDQSVENVCSDKTNVCKAPQPKLSPDTTQSSVMIPVIPPTVFSQPPSTPPQNQFKVPNAPLPSIQVFKAPGTVLEVNVQQATSDVRLETPQATPADIPGQSLTDEEFFEASFEEEKCEPVPPVILEAGSSTNTTKSEPSPSATPSEQNGTSIIEKDSEGSVKTDKNTSIEEDSVKKYAATQHLSMASSQSEPEVIQIDSSSEDEAEREPAKPKSPVKVVRENAAAVSKRSPATVVRSHTKVPTPSPVPKSSTANPQFSVRVIKSPSKVPQSLAKLPKSPTKVLISVSKKASATSPAPASLQKANGEGTSSSSSRTFTAGSSVIKMSPSPSTSQSSLNGSKKIQEKSDSAVKNERKSITEQDSVSKFAATQQLAVSQSQSEPEIIQIDSSSDNEAERLKEDDEIEVLSARIGPKKPSGGNTAKGKLPPKARIMARGDIKSTQRKMASTPSKQTAAGSSTQDDSVIRFASTQNLSPEYCRSQVEVMEIDDDDEDISGLMNLKTPEKVNPRDPKDEDDDAEGSSAYRFTQALDELTK